MLRLLQKAETFIRIRLKAAIANPDLFAKEAFKLVELDLKGNRRVSMDLAGNRIILSAIRQEKLESDGLAR